MMTPEFIADCVSGIICGLVGYWAGWANSRSVTRDGRPTVRGREIIQRSISTNGRRK